MTTRREFMVGAAGLTFTVLVDGCAAMRTEELRAGAALASAPAGGAKTVNAWASLAQDGTVYIVNPAVEMGQGSQTAIPLIIAEEMDADWSRVVIVPAAPDDKIYGNPGFRGLMYTAGSATVTGYWDVARTFGAQVRRVVMENAARLWNVPLAELSTEPSTVVHAKSGRDRKSTRLNSSHRCISYAVFCLKKKKQQERDSFNTASSASVPTAIAS